MASLKIKYRHSSIEGKAGTLFYQVIHNRVARQINSGYKIYPDEWDIFNSQIIIPAKTGENRHRYLVSLKKCIEEDTSRLKDIMIRFENLGYKYTADEIIEYYSAPPVNEYFVSFCENLIEELRQIGKIRTTETYTTTLNSFKRFMNFRKKGRDIPFDNIDSNLMMEYEQYLKSNDICPNSTSYYMRNLRAMYNRAVEKELVIQRYPFKHVYTGIDKTVKRAVPAKIIRQIRDMDLSHDSSLEYARDLFMFSFYTRGMSFIDMAYLKKSNLQNGFLSYRRKITDFKKKYNFLQFMMWEKSTGLKYIVVPDKQMESFIKIASQYEENTIYYKPEEIDIRKGTHICIYGGKFNGVKGVFMRVKGKRRRRVVVMLEGIMGISVEVHPDLIEVINDSDCDKF